VRLSEAEVDRIAANLGLEPRAFIERYTAVTADRRSLTLIERPDGGCILLTEDNQCRVHAVKPRQCQDFPERWRFPGFEALCQGCH
jgi:Fe-S-cluster containining protein